MFSKLIIDQNNKSPALFISEILKEEFDKILNDGMQWSSSEIVNFKQFKSNEIFTSNEQLNLYLEMGTPVYWSSIPLLEISLFYVFTNRPISVYFNEPEYNLIDFNGTTLRNIILNYIDSWKLMNLK